MNIAYILLQMINITALRNAECEPISPSAPVIFSCCLSHGLTQKYRDVLGKFWVDSDSSGAWNCLRLLSICFFCFPGDRGDWSSYEASSFFSSPLESTYFNWLRSVSQLLSLVSWNWRNAANVFPGSVCSRWSSLFSVAEITAFVGLPKLPWLSCAPLKLWTWDPPSLFYSGWPVSINWLSYSVGCGVSRDSGVHPSRR